MHYLSEHTEDIDFNYHHKPTVERYDAEISIKFLETNPTLFAIISNYIGVDFWTILPENITPSSHPLNSNS